MTTLFSIEIPIHARYLHLPVREGCQRVTARLMRGEQMVREFAIELAQQVYGGVFESGQPLHQALRYAMTELCGPPQTAAPRRHSALAVATPTLFGQALLSLSLCPRQAHAEPDAGDTPLARFPPPHERLVGRVRELTRASRAQALDSDYKGVLFHGLAGGGKTA